MNTKLITNASKKIISKSPKTLVPAMDYAEGLNGLIKAWSDCHKVTQTEKTKRAQIAADREVRLTAIREQASVVRLMIQETFAERGKNFSKFFELLDKGFETGNDHQINAALMMIVEQTKVNPMAQAVQLLKDINDPDVKAIEI